MLLLLLVAGSIPWCLKRPILALAIYLGANILRPEMFFWGGHTGSYLFLVYSAVIVIASFGGNYFSNLGRLRSREFLLMTWLFLAVLVSMFFADYYVIRSSYYAFELGKGFVICAFIYLLVSEFSEIRMVQNALLGCLALLGVWGVQQHFRGNERLEGLGGSAWGDSNGVASVFVLFLPVALAKAFSGSSRKERLFGWGCVAVMVVLVICTKSRGGLLGLVAAAVAFGFFTGRFRNVVVAALFMAVMALPFVTDSFLERVKTMESGRSLDGSASSRLVLWQAGLMIFTDHPVLGSGFLTYPEAKMKYQNRFNDLDPDFKGWVFREVDKKVTHNTYIQMLADCGLLGAIPFFLLVLGGVRAGFLARREAAADPAMAPEKREQLTWLAGISAGLAGFAVCILTIDSLLLPFIYVQLVFAGVLSRQVAPGREPDREVAGVFLACQERRT